jgi:hypothetical protein
LGRAEDDTGELRSWSGGYRIVVWRRAEDEAGELVLSVLVNSIKSAAVRRF